MHYGSIESVNLYHTQTNNTCYHRSPFTTSERLLSVPQQGCTFPGHHISHSPPRFAGLGYLPFRPHILRLSTVKKYIHIQLHFLVHLKQPHKRNQDLLGPTHPQIHFIVFHLRIALLLFCCCCYCFQCML